MIYTDFVKLASFVTYQLDSIQVLFFVDIR